MMYPQQSSTSILKQKQNDQSEKEIEILAEAKIFLSSALMAEKSYG